MTEEHDIVRKKDHVTVQLSSSSKSVETFFPHLDEPIYVALSFDKTLKYVSYKIKPFDLDATPVSECSEVQERNAFQILMGSTTKDAAKKTSVHTGTNLHLVSFCSKG